jgi:hypothetical protein
VVRVTRTAATLAATLQSSSGEATSHLLNGDGTAVVTIIATHTDSGVSDAQAVSAVQGGANGADGNDGAPGADGLSVHVSNVYQRAASPPSTPTGGSYNFTTQNLTPPSGWFVVPPSGVDPLYVSVASWSVFGQTGTDTSTTWTAPSLLVQDGADGAPGSAGSDGLDAGNWVYTGAFSSTDGDTVAWATGTLKDTAGSSYTITASNTGNMGAPTFIYWDPAVSTTSFQITATGTDAVGSGKILIATAVPSTVGDMASFTVFSGNPGPVLIAGDQLAATIAFLRDLIIGTGGKIRQGKTSASSTTAGFWLGHDGASNYDFHIGNASSSLWWDGSAGTLNINGILGGELDFAAQTFTPSWNGFSTAPTGDFSYIDFGSFVLMWTTAVMSGTSNANSMNLSGVPAAIRPADNRFLQCMVRDDPNGFGAFDELGAVVVDPSGNLTF